MKRSEIVKTIKDFFYNNDFYNFDDEHADLLLSKLESQGMLPPAYESYEKIPASFMFEDVYRKINVNEWESED